MESLRFVVGENVNEEGGFRVFRGEQEVTEEFDVVSLSFSVNGTDRDFTKVNLEVYAKVEVEGEVDVTTLCRGCHEKLVEVDKED